MAATSAVAKSTGKKPSSSGKKSVDRSRASKTVDKQKKKSSAKKQNKQNKQDKQHQKKKKKTRARDEEQSEEEEDEGEEQEADVVDEEVVEEEDADEDDGNDDAAQESSLTDEQKQKKLVADRHQRLNRCARMRGYRGASNSAGGMPKNQTKSMFSLASVARMVHFRQTVADKNTMPYDLQELKQRWDASFAKCPPSSLAALQPFVEGAARSLCNTAMLNAYNQGRTTVQPIHLVNACRNALNVLELTTVAPHGLIKYAQTHDKNGRCINDPPAEDSPPVSADDMMIEAWDADKEDMLEDVMAIDANGEETTQLAVFKQMINDYEKALTEKKQAAEAKKKGTDAAAPSVATKKRAAASSKKQAGKK
jgi:hypothetical protein